MKNNSEGKALAIAFISMISAIIVHSNFNNSLFYAWIMIWIWILLGVVERYCSSRNKHSV
jgi:hypothetical protein